MNYLESAQIDVSYSTLISLELIHLLSTEAILTMKPL